MILKRTKRKVTKDQLKFINNIRKILIDKKQVLEYSKRENWVIYDARTWNEYSDGHFPNSMHIFFFRLKHYILANDKKTKVLLISKSERKFISLVSWARYHGYKNIYLLKGGLDPKKDKKYLVKN